MPDIKIIYVLQMSGRIVAPVARRLIDSDVRES